MKKLLAVLLLGLFVLSALSAYAGGDQNTERNKGDKGQGTVTRTTNRKNK